MEKKTYVCTKMKLYGYLTSMGFRPYRTAPDLYDCNRLVWLYANSDELQDAVSEYYMQVV